MMSKCYCENKLTIEETNRAFKCETCCCFFHSTCIKNQPPSELLGDIFFKFTCLKCTSAQGGTTEEYNRIRLSWLQVIVLAMYNLQQRCDKGVQGHFKWKEHICNFINQQWHQLFDSSVKRTSKWQGTVAGVLSSYANVYFSSGMQVFKQSGWWKLMPGVSSDRSLMTPLKSNKRKQHDVKIDFEDNKRNDNACLSVIKNTTSKRINKLKTVTYNKKNSHKRDRADAGNLNKEEDEVNIIDVGDGNSSEDNDVLNKDLNDRSDDMGIKLESDDDVFQLTDSSDQDSSSKELRKKRDQSLHWKTRKDLTIEEKVPEFFLKGDEDEDYEDEDLCDIEVDNKIEIHKDGDVVGEGGEDCISNLPPLHQLFSSYDDSNWKNPTNTGIMERREEGKETAENDNKVKLVMISRYEERAVLKRLQTMHTHLPTKLNRLKTKLIMRQRKRELGLPIFNIDSYIQKLQKQPDNSPSAVTKSTNVLKGNELLDRYQHASEHKEADDQHLSFMQRLTGMGCLQAVKSPYTHKVLKAYIRRDTHMRPLKLQLMQQIIAHANRNNHSWQAPFTQPIDFVHVRPHFIPSINQLCRQFFWPDIDLTESLDYPDYSIVALYKNLVVGFAFMIPDVSVDECYLPFIFTHPEWRRAGIAKFMLFYLLQLEPHKDVTMHVSVSNSALLLYQKFSFKVEEFITNFYDKYLPFESTECRNAFYMRFKRFS